jgi:hypothetical protein
VDLLWAVCGFIVGCVLIYCGLWMDLLCAVCGFIVGCVWIYCGLCADLFWAVYGFIVLCVWIYCGLCVDLFRFIKYECIKDSTILKKSHIDIFAITAVNKAHVPLCGVYKYVLLQFRLSPPPQKKC